MPFAPLTSTTWSLAYGTSGGRMTYAPCAGICLLSGLPFAQWADVYEAAVNGVPGFVTVSSMHRLSIRAVGQTLTVQSAFVFVAEDMDMDALVAQSARITLLAAQPVLGQTVFSREDDGQWYCGCEQLSDQQVAAEARAAFMLRAERAA
jgi:hypothetical protein